MAGGVTGYEAGMSADKQLALALEVMQAHGGVAEMQAIYDSVARGLAPNQHLSEQGKASLRRIVNTYGVKAGYIYPFDASNPGWRITLDGKEYLESLQQAPVTEQVIDVDTQVASDVPANTVRGAIFERYIGTLLMNVYPDYAWTHTGLFKRNERGLDYYGQRFSPEPSPYSSIGAQVKLHRPNNAPTELEWLKFLSGCFARRIDLALFITTGKLTGNQHREAAEAKVVVISGLDEVNRHSARFHLDPFSESDLSAET